MTDDIGTYRVRNSTNQATNIWPLTSGTTVTQATAPHPVAPQGTNPIVVGTFGIVDLVALIPAGSPITRNPVTQTGLGTTTSGAGLASPVLFADADVASVCFAVATPSATTAFSGVLTLSLRIGSATSTVELPLEIRPNTEENRLVVVLALVATRTNYTWIQLKATDRNGGAAVDGARTDIRILRDNALVKDFNRVFTFTSTTSGHVARLSDRDLVGVPILCPIVFEFEKVDFVRRAHMLEFLANQRTGHHNNNPHRPVDVALDRVADASLAGRRFVFDPGHGVVYAAAAQRRSQEWFVAHRIATRAAQILRTRHAVADADIVFMRTAGLGLIDPNQIQANGAPEAGDLRFEYDMNARTLRIRTNRLTLTDVSDFLLTEHDSAFPFAARAVTPAQRETLLTTNAATLSTALTRQAGQLPGRQVLAATLRWDQARLRYVFDSAAAGVVPPVGDQIHNLRINTTDLFQLNNDMLRRLARRTACWSLASEVSGGPQFKTIARDAMIAQNGLNYFTDAVLGETDRPNGHLLLSHGNMGWLFSQRRQEMQALSPAPDLIATIHLNAVPTDGSSAGGFVLLASNVASATEAHLRLQKTFIKHLHSLGRGLRQRGMTNTHTSALNGASNAALIEKFAFFELEFMNAQSPITGFTFDYQSLVEPAFVDRMAEQMVAAFVEFLLNPQPNANFDPVDVGAGISAGTVRW